MNDDELELELLRLKHSWYYENEPLNLIDESTIPYRLTVDDKERPRLYKDRGSGLNCAPILLRGFEKLDADLQLMGYSLKARSHARSILFDKAAELIALAYHDIYE